MIKNIYIKNFELIENASVEFADGLNVIIGETGSGKSMLIDALIVLFGGRVSADMVGKNSDKTIIEAEIEISNINLKDIINSSNIDLYDDNIIIRREITNKGNVRNFINDTPVNRVLLNQIGDIYIDFHGQHDHQSLLNSASHAEILDKSAGINNLITAYEVKFNELKNFISEYKKLLTKEKSIREKTEFNKFRLEEINKIDPKENEDELIESELKILENSEVLFGLSSELYEILYNSGDSVFNTLSKAKNILKNLNSIDSVFEDYINEIESSLISLKEIAYFSNNYSHSIEFKPERIEEIRLRLLQLKGLQKKFGTISEIIDLRKELESEVSLSSNFDIQKNSFESSIQKLKSDIFNSGIDIEMKRKDYAEFFSAKIESSLSELGINRAKIEVKIDRLAVPNHEIDDLTVKFNNENFSLFSNGINQIEFFVSTNPGETVKPLKQVASGGEISRIMLSIKNILAGQDSIECLVFDEIDTGVSGRIAQMVGNTMKNLSNFHQIIAISHLPQIAAAANACLLVEKIESESKTFSTIRLLNENEKVFEIAKMMSGKEISDAAINTANALINSI